MYHPVLRELVECKLKILNENGKYLTNEYIRVQQKHGRQLTTQFDRQISQVDSTKVEYYDFVKINLFDGMVTDRSAYDTLVKKYGCSSDMISFYNVLKIRLHDFERIFVFYRNDPDKSTKDNIIEGEKKLEKLIKALNLMCKILS